ncbi:unnamed protein product [Rotaria sp. Silwood2]|nr:unnamed protein product [Rotaria sp. Silwood2]CAF4186983.1 unnamed protein product [Rotaria sp. Silwood2]CAF4440970.1 unnamed protein product [Rotaria sp. Silwood2]
MSTTSSNQTNNDQSTTSNDTILHEDDLTEQAKIHFTYHKMWHSTSSPLFQGIAQPLMYCWSLLTSLTTSGVYLSRILAFLPKLRVTNLFSSIDQLTAWATCQ